MAGFNFFCSAADMTEIKLTARQKPQLSQSCQVQIRRIAGHADGIRQPFQQAALLQQPEVSGGTRYILREIDHPSRVVGHCDLAFGVLKSAYVVSTSRHVHKRELKDGILRLHDEGFNLREIAQQVGLHWTRVWPIRSKLS